MRVEPEQIKAVCEQLRSWGVVVMPEVEADLVAEFDVRSDPKANAIGKFSKEKLTSRQAALRVYPRTGSQRYRILEYLRSQAGIGGTREEIAHHLEMSPDSVRPRVVELIEGGWIRPSSWNRRTKLGEWAEVLIVTQRGAV